MRGLRIVFVVLDGLPAEVAGPEVTPVLAQWCADSGTALRTIPAVLPASTYPNHATFVTGALPVEHGIVGNHVRGDDGRFRAASAIGPSVATIFDATAAAGLTSAVVVGDQELVGVMGAHAASSHWPPGGQVPDGAATDAHGYLHDDETLPQLLDVIGGDAHLVFGHLNAPDTAGHVEGPDRAHDVYRATDARLGPLRTAVEARPHHTIVVIVSDHSMEPVTERAPVDLTPALGGTDLEWFPEGSAALVYGAHADVPGLLAGTPGVAGVEPLGHELHVVWGDEGRWLCFAGIDGERGTHGGPRTAHQLAAVVGTDAAVRELDAHVASPDFDATSWYGELHRLLGI